MLLMRCDGVPSWWHVRVEQWEEGPDLALWLRAAERIDVPPHGIVPGPLHLRPLPDRTIRQSGELSDAWIAWWSAIVAGGITMAADGTSVSPDWLAMVSPDFTGLAGWPQLQSVVRARWMEAKTWHDHRQQRAAPSRESIAQDRRWRSQAGDALERWGRLLGREVDIELLLVPAADVEIRPIRANRYLLSEDLYQRPDFPETLASFIDALWNDLYRPTLTAPHDGG